MNSEQLSEDDVQVLLRLLDDFASSVQGDTVEQTTLSVPPPSKPNASAVTICSSIRS